MGDLVVRLRQLFFLTALMAVIPLAATAAEWHRLAYSKALSIEIFAETIDGGWCKRNLRLRLMSDDASVFRQGELGTLLRKLGAVIEQECSIASKAFLIGVTRSSGEQVFGGTISRADKWALDEMPSALKHTDQITDRNSLPPSVTVAEPRTKSERTYSGAGTASQRVAGNSSDKSAMRQATPDKGLQPTNAENSPSVHSGAAQLSSFEWILFFLAGAVATAVLFVWRKNAAKNTMPDTGNLIDNGADAGISPDPRREMAEAAPLRRRTSEIGSETASEHVLREPMTGRLEEISSATTQAALDAYLNGNYGEAHRILRELASENVHEAQFGLAVLYQIGRGVGRDLAEAVRWYKTAAENGSTAALQELGSAYKEGAGVAQDFHAAIEWYQKAGDAGAPMGWALIGTMYELGEGVGRSDVEAFQFYLKAAEEGLDVAQWSVGLGYRLGRGVSQNDGEAVKWYRKAADQGYVAAQTDLGLMYLTGTGVPSDVEKGAQLIASAAEAGDPEAQAILAALYDEGLGVEKSSQEAIRWLKSAAEAGSSEAQLQLGLKYQSGEDLPLDQAQAVIWFRKSADQGHQSAQTMLGFLYDEGEGVPSDQEQAFKWFYEAAKKGEAEAQYNIGLRYAEGRGINLDRDAAIKWFEVAAAQGHADAEAARNTLQQNAGPSANKPASLRQSGMHGRLGDNDEVVIADGPVVQSTASRDFSFSDLGRVHWGATIKLALVRGFAAGVVWPIIMTAFGPPVPSNLESIGIFLIIPFAWAVGAQPYAIIFHVVGRLFGLFIPLLGPFIALVASLMICVGDPLVYILNRYFPRILNIADLRFMDFHPMIFITHPD